MLPHPGPLSRRNLLGRVATGFPLLALQAMMAEPSSAGHSLRPRTPDHRPRARSVIFLFMGGGPSQMDLLDPKPALARYDRVSVSVPPGTGALRDAPELTPLPSPWRFRQHGQSGIWLSELLPHLSHCVDHLCVIRSLYCDQLEHSAAIRQLVTGEGLFSRPSLGSWLLYGLGAENDSLPGFVCLAEQNNLRGTTISGSSFLPAVYQGTRVPGLSLKERDRPPIANLGSDPPPGPVGDTPGPEPRIPINDTNTPGVANARYFISQPGSYYLEGDIDGAGFGQNAILIDSGDVTIDLMGFAVRDDGLGSMDGICTLGPQDNITILNGTVSGWQSNGINIADGSDSAVIRNVRAIGNGLTGILADAQDSIIDSCVARTNGGAGISTASGAVVRACNATDNEADGILTGGGAVVSQCTARLNEGSGIVTSSRSNVSHSASEQNTGAGFDVGGLITACTASNNGTAGIAMSFGGAVSNCNVSSNTQCGISVAGGCLVLESNVYSTRVGIRATASRNRIDGNHITQNDTGVELQGTENFLFRCTFANNTTNLDVIGGGTHQIGEFTGSVVAAVNAFANITDN